MDLAHAIASRRMARALPWLLAGLALGPGGSGDPPRALPRSQSQGAGRAAPPQFVLDRGPDQPAIVLPRDETLVYRAYLDIAMLETAVGKVTQTCTVEAVRPSVLVSEPGHAAGESAVVRLHAEGHYAWYTLESTIESRILPQEWPRILYLQTSVGSERRRREVMLGQRDGKPLASYRRDTDRGAPEGTRIWRPATEREVPAGTLDMLNAVLMARTLIRERKQSITFPLIDKTRVWQLVISRGEARRIETGAGLFEALELVLTPGPYPGEVFEDEKLKQFEGVFGIHGTIHLWVERKTGIAVRIQGDLPVGPITLGIDVVLERYSGTPADFVPVASDR